MLGKTTCFTLMLERGVGSRAVPLRIWNTFIARMTAVKQSSGKTRVFVIVLLNPRGFVIVPVAVVIIVRVPTCLVLLLFLFWC